ncbi:MAG: MYG1 family protein [Candidatus Paceibacterota bacterium]
MKKIKVVTHNGDFHSDDVFAVAILQVVFGKDNIEVLRTRDESFFDSADILLDLGGIYDEEKNRFDHHQSGGAGQRENGIPYASAGLVWKKFGEQICGSKEIALSVDEKLFLPIDANDNGVNIYGSIFGDFLPYTIQDLVNIFRATWKEEKSLNDERFIDVVSWAQKIIEREVLLAKHYKEAEALVEQDYQRAEDKRLIILNGKYPWSKVLMNHPEPLFVVYQDGVNDFWRVKAVGEDKQVFKNRKDFPASWAGKRDAELAEITKVPDSLFCHNKLFLAVAKSKEGALALAKIALEN